METLILIIIGIGAMGLLLWFYFKPKKDDNKNTYDPNVDYDDTEIDDTEPTVKPPKV